MISLCEKKKEKEKIEKIKTSVQKNWAKLLKKKQKIVREFLHEFGIENYKEKEHLHYANVSVFIKFAKYRR